MARICHIAATSEGAVWMAEQLRDLRDTRGHEVFAIIAGADGGLPRLLDRYGVPFERADFDFPPAEGWQAMVGKVARLEQLIRRGRFDVVQTHLFASMVMGRLAAWLADAPVRLAMIAGPYHLEAPTPRWIDGSTAWMETALIPSCVYSRDLYRGMGLPVSRLRLAYYGPDPGKFDPAHTTRAGLREALGLPEMTRLVGMVAYFYPVLGPSGWTPPALHGQANKRQEDLIRAAPAILAAVPDTKILLIGSAWGEAGEPALARARDLVRELGLERDVLFLGYRSDVGSILVDLDVTVQASVSENLGGSIEALLMECPIVATRTGGLVDTVRDGETGVLVEPLDPDDLARGIIRLLADPAEAKAMARAGRRLALERFCLDSTVRDLDAIYAELGAGRRRGYRFWVRWARALLAWPVYAYLAGRLYWDVRGRAMAAAERERLTHAGRARVAALRDGVERRSAAVAAAGRRVSHAGRARVSAGYAEIRGGSATVATARRRLAGAGRKRVSALGAAVRRSPATASAAGRRLAAASRARAAALRYDLRTRAERGVAIAADLRRRALRWLWLQPLYFYGWIRSLLQGTETLRRWDRFFAVVRGRPPP